MKRLLAFLLLFGAGLLVLDRIEDRRGAEAKDDVVQRRRDAIPPVPPSAPDGLGFRGRFDVVLYDEATQRALLRVTSEDTRTEGTSDVLTNVELEILDAAAEEGASIGRVEAREARLPRDAEESLGTLRPRYTNVVELRDVEALLEGALPVSWLAIESPGARLVASDPTDIVLSSEEALRFESPELRGTSTGYRLHLVRPAAGGARRSERMELLRDGVLGFRSTTREGEAGATLRSAGEGALEIRRTGAEEPRPIVLEAWEGARLELEGPSDPRLDARHLTLLGRTADGDDLVRIERLLAEGDVLWSSAEGVYRAEECTLTFDELRRPVDALLRGEPVVRFLLSVDPERLAGLNDDERRAVEELEAIEVRSDDEVHVELEGQEGIAFRAAGPARVQTSEIELRSNGDVIAHLSDDARTVRLKGSAGVEVDTPDAALQTATFALTFERSAEGVATLYGVASDGTRLEGRTRDGRAFVVTSPERLEVERRGDRWRIVEGVDVSLTVGEPGEPDAFLARCDRVVDFDVEATSFDATGNVSFEGGGRRVAGERLLAHGPEHMEMWGADGERAELESDRGSARARYVEVEGGRLHAEGLVEATVANRADASSTIVGVAVDQYELDCEELDVLRTQAERGGVVEHRLDIAARGAVRSTLVTQGRTIQLEHADRMVAERLERVLAGDERSPLQSIVRLEATGDVSAQVVVDDDALDVTCDELLVGRTAVGDLEPAQEILARGNVRFAGSAQVSFRGEGDVLELRADRTGTLSAPDTGEVRLDGFLPGRDVPFGMRATRADFSESELRAIDPDLVVQGHRVRAKELWATPEAMRLDGDVRLSGATSRHPWHLSAGAVEIVGEPGAATFADAGSWSGRGTGSILSRLRTEGGFRFDLGDRIVASGSRLTHGRSPGLLRMEGEPAAQISTPFGVYEAEWIEFDPVSQVVTDTGAGRIRSKALLPPASAAGGNGGPSGTGAQEEEPQAAWEIEFLTSSTMYDGGSLVYLLQEPTFRYPATNSTLRASWVVLWVDRARWEVLTSGSDVDLADLVEDEPGEERPPGVMGVFFDAVARSNVSGLVREAYFEGPVEVYEGDRRIASADAVYLGLRTGRGFLVNASVRITGKRLGGKLDEVIVKARLINHARDGSLSARNATITPCSFEEPHVRIVTGDLRITPLENTPDTGYEVSLRKNRIEFDWFRVPLPPLEYDTDEALKPRLPTLRFGDTARFGQLLSIRLRGPAKRIGRAFDGVVSTVKKDGEEAPPAPGGEGEEGEEGGEEEPPPRRRSSDVDAEYDLDASYLGSRGALLDVGLLVEKERSYWFEFLTGVALDSGRDRGYVRVPKGQRDYTRLWLRSQGWFDLGDGQTLVTAYSDQSDPGVQAEFFESELTSRERDETYVQWKRRDEHTWLQASVRPRVDEFRAGVEELPSFTAFRSRAPVARLGKLPLVHTGDLSAAYLRRLSPRRYDLDGDGIKDSALTSPFGPSGVYPDGTSPHDSLRVDSTQALELPLPLPLLGLKLVPFARARGTAWTNAVDDGEATRVVAEAGARLSTVLWRRTEDSVHQLAPYVQYTAELANEEHGRPHVFDETETAMFGDFVQVGTRARFGLDEADEAAVDLDVRATYASDRSDGGEEGWLPVEVYSSLGLGTERRPLDIWWDTRFDTRVGETVYSLFAIGTRIDDRTGVQVSHTFGRGDAFEKLFDAVSTSAFYRWTDKWEFEAQHSFSLIADQRLGLDLLVRRYGHDAIFELETSVREGEGSSLGIGLRPRLGFTPRRIGLIFYR